MAESDEATEKEISRLRSHSEKISAMRTLQQKSFILKDLPPAPKLPFSDSKTKRLQKKLDESPLLSSFTLKYALFRHPDYFSFIFFDLISQLALHPLNTLKNRLQVRSMTQDLSLYFKNNVQKKPVTLGFSYSLWLSLLNSSTSFSIAKLVRTNFPEMELKKSLELSFLLWNVLTLPFRCLFEIKRIHLQMGEKNQSFGKQISLVPRALPAIFLRDFFFQTTFLEINAKLQKENKIMPVSQIFLAGIIPVFASNAFDVYFSRFATQKLKKITTFTGFLNDIVREEGWYKLLAGGGIRYLSFVLSTVAVSGGWRWGKKKLEDAFTLESLLD